MANATQTITGLPFDKMITDRLEKRDRVPRVHGNGFIQLDLEDNFRMHVWSPLLKGKAQKTYTPIHDHVFDMHSTIVYGTLVQVEYKEIYNSPGGPTHDVYVARRRDREDTVLEKIGQSCSLKTVGCSVYSAHKVEGEIGRFYYFKARELHETMVPDGQTTITVIEKCYPKQERTYDPRVLCPVGMKPDNDFNRYQLDEEFLWKVIDTSMEQAKRE